METLNIEKGTGWESAEEVPTCSSEQACDSIQMFLNTKNTKKKNDVDQGDPEILNFLNTEISLEEKWEIKSEGIKEYILDLENKAIILKKELNEVLEKLEFQKRRLEHEFKALV
tara:strand:- start:7099 stop:7440 length:342 start_codon:yes stop_codon:yes gene_type:complete